MVYPEFPIPSIVMWFDASAEDLKPGNVQARVYDPRHDLFFFTSNDLPHREQSTLNPSVGVVDSISKHLCDAIWDFKVTYDAARDIALV